MELNLAPKSTFIHKLPQKSAVWVTNHGGFNLGLTSRKFQGRNTRVACRGEDGKSIGTESWTQILPSRVELLEPSMLGIWPGPPDWPERDEVCRIDIEQKAKCFGIPHSLRMIKRKQKWKEGFADAGEFAYCCVKKAFSSLVLMIRELQSYTLVIREGLSCEDLVDVMNKMQRDFTLTFVRLFQQVFSKTPTLMVYVMLLLANYSVHWMSDKEALIGQPVAAEYLKVDGELVLWRSMVEDHLRTNLVYQMRIWEEPENSLLLLNYAHFLYLVVKEHDRAEEYFKRAIRVEPQDPEALEQVRKDHPEAEERYLEALEADNMNTPFRASKYAYFLWGTGGEGTCFPL